MKRLALTIMLLLTPSFAAATPWSLGLGLETRLYEDYNGQDARTDQLPSGFVTYQVQAWRFVLDVARSNTSSSQGSLRVKTVSTDVMPWVHYTFRPTNGFLGFAGLGRGLVREAITTDLSGSGTVRKSDSVWQTGFTTGLSMDVWQSLFTQFDIKILRSDVAEDSVFSFGLRIGWWI